MLTPITAGTRGPSWMLGSLRVSHPLTFYATYSGLNSRKLSQSSEWIMLTFSFSQRVICPSSPLPVSSPPTPPPSLHLLLFL